MKQDEVYRSVQGSAGSEKVENKKGEEKMREEESDWMAAAVTARAIRSPSIPTL